ncbi:MAG: DUF1848 domain-containing protein [Treponema sp.]|jgi:hypothetical protein|nr:DUF1848 domain-containing protein [Treponema sp.]
MIVSVSRRCDIPRFQFDWFLERLEAGFADVPNPFNAAQIRRVPLVSAEDAPAFVFWTRDPRNIAAHAGELEGRGCRFYTMVTVTGYPAALESGALPAETAAAAVRLLAEKTGARRVIWRYDPVFVSSITDYDFHRRNFGELSRALAGAVRRVIISLYDEYGGAKRRVAALEKAGAFSMMPMRAGGAPVPEVKALIADLASMARGAGMEMQSCAEDAASLGIGAGACIDGDLMRELWGMEAPPRDKHQRPLCLCAEAVDIGRYGSCPGGCVYCYARR